MELKNILPPADIQSSMEKQMKAERDRRQAILQAEGQKKSAILIAEGEKESAILRASAEKEAAILKAEAERQAAILKAEGEADAIRQVQQALADSLKLLNESAPNDQVVKLKALEAMQKVADGKATKIITIFLNNSICFLYQYFAVIQEYKVLICLLSPLLDSPSNTDIM